MISACLVVFNEEQHIEDCLFSIYKVVDEIIVVHDGECKDNTLEIAKKFGAKIFIKPWIGFCEIHRVFSFQMAVHDWILMIDADERLSPQLQKEIRSLTVAKDVDGYEFNWNIWDGKKEVTKGWPHKAVLFRKEKMNFLAFPHMSVSVDGIMKHAPLDIEHRPNYDNYTWSCFQRKWKKWAKIQAEYTLKPYSSLENFCPPTLVKNNYSKKSLLKRYFSFLFPLIGFYAFLLKMKTWTWKNGKYKFIVACMDGLYNAYVYYYVTKIKASTQK